MILDILHSIAIRSRSLLVGILLISPVTQIAAKEDAEPAKPTGRYALLGGKVATISGETLNGAAILVADGKIEDVIDDADHTYTPPEGYEVIDARCGSIRA